MNFRISILILSLACLLLSSCRSSVSSLKIESEKWVALKPCHSNDLYIFDFFNKTVKTMDGQVYKLDIRKKSLVITKRDTLNTIKFDKIIRNGDTLIIKDKSENYATFLPIDKLLCKNVDFDMFLRKSSLLYQTSLNSSSNEGAYYFDFITDEDLVITSVNLDKNDTISEVKKWQLFSLDSLSILSINDIFCIHYFITEFDEEKFTTIQANSFGLQKMEFNQKIPEFQNAIDAEDLVGEWKVVETSSLSGLLKHLSISRDSLLVNPGSVTQTSGVWKLDRFGRIILTNLDGELHYLHVKKMGDILKIEMNGNKYQLNRISN